MSATGHLELRPYETILVAEEAEGQIVTLTLNRPEARNAISRRMAAELADALLDLGGRREARVVIVTSAGDRAFCAGADLKERLTLSPDERIAHTAAIEAAAEALAALPMVTIAAVRGFALAGGTELAIACDLRVAATDAVFGLPEVKIGIFPGAGGVLRLPRLVGAGAARDLLFTGSAGRGRGGGAARAGRPPGRAGGGPAGGAGAGRASRRQRAAGRARRQTRPRREFRAGRGGGATDRQPPPGDARRHGRLPGGAGRLRRAPGAAVSRRVRLNSRHQRDKLRYPMHEQESVWGRTKESVGALLAAPAAGPRRGGCGAGRPGDQARQAAPRHSGWRCPMTLPTQAVSRLTVAIGPLVASGFGDFP